MKKTTKTSGAVRAKSKKLIPGFQTVNDLRNAVLIVSLLANLFVVCLWLTVLVTTRYDAVLAQFFFGR